MLEKIHTFLNQISFEIKIIWFVSVLTSFSFLALNGGWEEHPDSYDYIQGIDAVLNGEDWYDHTIAFRPGAVYFSLPFTLFFNNENSVGIHNLIFYLLIGPLFYKLINYFIVEDKFSLYSTLFFLTSFPIIYWGLSTTGDLGSYFFIILSIFSMIYIVNNNFPIKGLVLSSISTGIGILYKTTVSATPIFFTLFVIYKANVNGILRSLTFWLLFALISFSPLIANQLYIDDGWDLKYEDDIREMFQGRVDPDDEKLELKANDPERGFKFTFYYKIVTLFIAFPVLPLALFGFKDVSSSLNKEKKIILSLITFSCLLIISLLSIYIASPRWTLILLIPVYVLLALCLKYLYVHMEKLTKLNQDSVIIFIILLHALASVIIASYDSQFREILGFWSKS